MVTVEEGLKLVHENVPAVTTEILPIEEAIGRVAAEKVHARFDLPRFDNAAMDGYAVTMADAGGTIHSQATLFAGDVCDMRVTKGHGVRIMTGAMMPEGAEAVIPIEEITTEGEQIRLPDRIKRGANIKKRGEDVAKGDPILHPGDRISGYTIALLASQGITHLKLHRKPRVAVFATGLELKLHFETVDEHQIYNSNAPMTVARALELGCEARFVGSAGDTLEAIKAHIENCLDHDLIVTSGGISVGDADYTLQAFEALGMEILFSKVKIKPGKPTTLGRIGNTWVLTLPGNPSAAALNFELFGRTVINRLRGLGAPFIAPLTVANGQSFRLKPGRPTVLLGRYDGEKFEILTKQGPGMVRPLHEADGFIVTDGDTERIEESQSVRMIPLFANPTSSRLIDIFTR